MELQNTLQAIIHDLVEKKHQIFIIIDALDECRESASVAAFVAGIADNTWIAFTSRYHAEYSLKYKPLEIVMNSANLNQDINIYMEAEMSNLYFLEGFKGEVKGTLQTKADGRSVSCCH